MTTAIGIAGPSEIAVRAGAEAAAEGGNAVDAAVAAALAALATEVAIVGLDAAAFVTAWAPGEQPLVIDGGIAMPGIDRPPERFGAGGRHVQLDYGGGMQTIVGYGSVGVGGAVAALGEISAARGRLPWEALVDPAARRVEQGFPLGLASHTWLGYSHREIFGWQPEAAAVIHDAAGRLRSPGDIIRIPGLHETLRALGRDGPGSFYTGRISEAIAACVDAGGGLMSMADRRAYRALHREPLQRAVDGWQIAMPPEPAVGGAALAAMLERMTTHPRLAWDAPAVAVLAQAQRDVFEQMERLHGRRSASTIHVSALDAEGLGCAITASSGYGSGALVPGMGIWLNNCLGELELNPRGFHGMTPGERMASNMCPVVGRRGDGSALVLGSPGAERITTALLQVILNFMRLGTSLEEALAAPRLHLERADGGWRAAVEPGLPLSAVGFPCREFDGLSMFFGGAGAVLREADGRLVAAADPRRQGAALVTGDTAD